MNKKLLILIAFISAVLMFSLKTNAQVCQNLDAGDDVQMQCTDTDVTLTANYVNNQIDFKETSNYIVENVPICDTPQTGSQTGIDVDDYWMEVPVELRKYPNDPPFLFCFFGNVYDQIVISPNGILTFDLTQAFPNNLGDWQLDANDQIPSQNYQTNAIFCPYHDMDTRIDPRPDRITYEVTGEWPNRVFSVNYESYQYDCETLLSKSQVRLYETTNVIDIIVLQKPVCSWNDGLAVLGIQNKSGTIGVTPPNRNIGVWEPPAEGESWRFIPDGDVLEFTFVWKDDNGNVLNSNNDLSITVNPQVTTTYTAEVSLNTECTGSINITDEVTVTPGFTPDIINPVDMTECENPAGSGTFDYNIDQTNYILNGLDPADFNISYHTSFEDAQANSNPIAVLNPYTSASTIIYIRVEDANDPTCATIREFTLTTISQDSANITYTPNEFCIEGENPTPDPDSFDPIGTFDINNGGVIDMNTGEVNLALSGFGDDNTGNFTITYNILGPCPFQGTFDILIKPMDDSSFDYPTNQYCNDDANPLPTNVATPGGTFTIDNGGVINATTGEIDLAASGLGTDGSGNFTVTYTTNGDCPTSTDFPITIEETKDASFDYPATACIDGANPTPINIISSGGTFSVDNGATIDPVTGELDLSTTIANTTYNVTYLFTGFCPSSSSQTIQILPMDNSSFDYPTNQYCNDDANPLPTNVATPGGTFTIDNGGVINATTGEIDLAASGLGTDGSGVFTIEYETSGNCPTTSPFVITIEETKDASFDYPATACIDGANPTPSNIATSGGIFGVDNGATIDPITGELDLSTTTANTTYTVTYSFAGNCPSSSSQTIQILPMDNSFFDYPTNLYCNDDANPLPTNVATPGGTFTINNGGVIDATTGEINLAASGLGTNGTGVFTIEYETSGNCPTTSPFDITIEERKDASFDYPAEVCTTDDNPMPSNIVEIGGEFSVNPSSATIDSVTGELDLATVTEGVDYTITYFLAGFCEDSKDKVIHINESPVATTPTTVLSSCDKGDGTADFDISTIENEIIGNQSNVTVTYYTTEADAEAGSNALDTMPFLVASDNVWVRVENSLGCYAVTEVPLIIEDCVVIIPQGFSPNSNIPENQVFYIPLIRTKYPKFEIYIYNRYGNEVYSGNINTDDWNGKLDNKGDLLPAGTYFYGIKANDEDDIQYRGWVYLNY